MGRRAEGSPERRTGWDGGRRLFSVLALRLGRVRVYFFASVDHDLLSGDRSTPYAVAALHSAKKRTSRRTEQRGRSQEIKGRWETPAGRDERQCGSVLAEGRGNCGLHRLLGCERGEVSIGGKLISMFAACGL